ncbi:MAG: AMP-binding protein [Parvibaculaceae bacterium]|nr:AMP-binding protein [Parvibaculaceae bacterium]
MRLSLANPHVHPFAGFDIPHLLALHATSRPDHPFLIWEPFEGEPETWSYRRFYEDARRVAAGLQARGVNPGDRVLLHFDNCPEILIGWFACAHLGAVALTTNARSVADELNYFAGHSRAVGAITQPKFAGLVASSCPDIGWLVVTSHDNGAAPAPGHVPAHTESFASLYGDADAAPLRAPDPMRPISIQYTSGTTARPKGVLWTHANALWGAKLSAQHEDLQSTDRHLTYLPLFHTNAQSYSVLAALWAGATVVLLPRFSASRFWEVSLRRATTWTSMVPFCLKALLSHEVPAHHYRFWGNGVCEPASDAHFRVKTVGWWGMTETITHGTVGSTHLPDVPMTMGRPSPAYEITVIDENGKATEPGETGALRIRGIPGLSLFSEYLDNPQATEESFDEHGFFITGDRAKVLASGYLQFADRDKDMLKVGGENVAASEIERVIMTVPGIHECAVVARKDPMLDEVPVAFLLVPDAGEDMARRLGEAVISACTNSLAGFKVPREVRVLDAFPRSTLEKIAKAELRRMLETRE